MRVATAGAREAIQQNAAPRSSSSTILVAKMAIYETGNAR